MDVYAGSLESESSKLELETAPSANGEVSNNRAIALSTIL